MKTEYLHIRMTAGQRAILDKLKGNKTITQYIIDLILADEKNK
jgi:hypothetical protein